MKRSNQKNALSKQYDPNSTLSNILLDTIKTQTAQILDAQTEALDTLIDIMRNGNPSQRQKAAVILLKYPLDIAKILTEANHKPTEIIIQATPFDLTEKEAADAIHEKLLAQNTADVANKEEEEASIDHGPFDEKLAGST